MATVTEQSGRPAALPTTDARLDLHGRDADRLHRLTAEQYQRLADSGVFGLGDKMILLDGLLVDAMTKGNRHSAAIVLVLDGVRATLPAGWHPRTEAPIFLAEGPAGHPSFPEPDLMVVRGSPRDFLERTPEPADVGLVAEVADSSLSDDRRMLARYAFAGVAVAWIVNLPGRVVEVHRDPTGPTNGPHYRDVETFREADEIPILLDGQEVGRVAVRDLLP